MLQRHRSCSHAAVERNDATELATLLGKGAASDGGLLAAASLGHGECLQLLLAAHAAVDQADSDDQTPLHAACFEGHGDCVQLLLAAHAAIDQADSDGNTPLFVACDRGHGGCVPPALGQYRSKGPLADAAAARILPKQGLRN